MKKILRELGVHFITAIILLGMSLFIHYDGVDRGQRSLMMVTMCGALVSIGGYLYLKNKKGIVMMAAGVVVLGLALFTYGF